MLNEFDDTDLVTVDKAQIELVMLKAQIELIQRVNKLIDLLEADE
jgi:hypothetical protein